jgi:hypothetical protein
MMTGWVAMTQRQIGIHQHAKAGKGSGIEPQREAGTVAEEQAGFHIPHLDVN